MNRLHADVLWAAVVLGLILVLVLSAMSAPAVVPAEVRDHWPTTSEGAPMPEDLGR